MKYTDNELKILEKRFDYIEEDYLETWTNGGVDMIIYIDEEDNNIIDTLERYINNFDISEEIDMYRQDEKYREDFTIIESVKDFENWVEYIKETIEELKGNEKVAFRDIIKEKLEVLDSLGNSDYKALEVALMLYLRSDIEDFDDLTDKQLDNIFELTDNTNSLLDINYEDIDYILNATDEDLK